jgi:hypothetical protein
MELHTLGFGTGVIPQADVQDVARRVHRLFGRSSAQRSDSFRFVGRQPRSGRQAVCSAWRIPAGGGQGADGGNRPSIGWPPTPRSARFLATKLAVASCPDTPPRLADLFDAAAAQRFTTDARRTLRETRAVGGPPFPPTCSSPPNAKVRPTVRAASPQDGFALLPTSALDRFGAPPPSWHESCSARPPFNCAGTERFPVPRGPGSYTNGLCIGSAGISCSGWPGANVPGRAHIDWFGMGPAPRPLATPALLVECP